MNDVMAEKSRVVGYRIAREFTESELEEISGGTEGGYTPGMGGDESGGGDNVCKDCSPGDKVRWSTACGGRCSCIDECG